MPGRGRCQGALSSACLWPQAALAGGGEEPPRDQGGPRAGLGRGWCGRRWGQRPGCAGGIRRAVGQLWGDAVGCPGGPVPWGHRCDWEPRAGPGNPWVTPWLGAVPGLGRWCRHGGRFAMPCHAVPQAPVDSGHPRRPHAGPVSGQDTARRSGGCRSGYAVLGWGSGCRGVWGWGLSWFLWAPVSAMGVAEGPPRSPLAPRPRARGSSSTKGSCPLGDTKAGSPGGSRAGDRLGCPLCSAAEVGAIRGSLGCPRVTMSLQLWDMSLGCPCVSVSLQHPGHILRVSPRGCVPGVSPQNLGHVPRVSPWPCPRAPSTHPQGVPAWLCPWGVPKAPRTRSQGVPTWPCPRGVPMAPRISPRGVPAWPCPRGVLAAPGTHAVPGRPQGCAVTVVAVRGPPGLWLSRGGHSGPSGWGGRGGVPTEHPPVRRGQTHVTPQWHSSAAAGGSRGDWGRGDPPRDPLGTPQGQRSAVQPPAGDGVPGSPGVMGSPQSILMGVPTGEGVPAVPSWWVPGVPPPTGAQGWAESLWVSARGCWGSGGSQSWGIASCGARWDRVGAVVASGTA